MKPEKAGKMVKVDMGEPIFEPEKIPIKINPKSKILASASRLRRQNPKVKISNLNSQFSNLVIDYPLKIKDKEFKITCVSMGNPHAVVVVKGVSDFPVAYYGPLIENHPIFPKRTNVEFIEVLNPSEITMHVWERGAGETMACGTGASAVAVASHVKGLTGRTVTIHLLGGDLSIEWAHDNHIYMTGPAEKVFEGTIEV
jgi:diaminopimelate epimerase